MNLVQFRTADGSRRVGIVAGSRLRVLAVWSTIYELANAAISANRKIVEMLVDAQVSETVAFDDALAEGRVLPPLDHADPAHCFVTGTGLTHLGSAQARDAMHAAAKTSGGDEALTDSMRLFRLGVLHGKPAQGTVPMQPEWFYKGDGSFVVAPEQPLESPDFADDGGEEPEIVGCYLVGPDGTPFRVGFALGNEFSDHVMERKNYLYLSHSKLRQCSFGPEIWVGDLPADINGRVRIIRDGVEHWSASFVTGEANMSFRISGLEHHHFKYRQFRRPGDVHVHFFGTSTLSISSGINVRSGDEFEISAPPFTRPLRNRMISAVSQNVKVSSL